MPSSAAPWTTGRPAPPRRRGRPGRPGCRDRRRERPGPATGRRRPSPASVGVGQVGASDRCRHRPPGRQPGRRPDQVVVGPLPVGAVVVVEEGQPDGGRLPLLQQVAHEDQVAERLGHLGAVQADQADVQPVADEGRAGGRLGLGRLALVVGEDQVAPAAVDVDGLAQLAQGQGRALDVPARAGPGPTGTPTTARRAATAATARSRAGGACWGRRGCRRARPPWPAWSARSKWLTSPKRGEGGDVEVDRPAGLVGVARVEHRADEGEDLGDGRGGPGLGPRRDQAEGRHVARRTGRSPRRPGRGSGRRARGPCAGCRRRRR